MKFERTLGQQEVNDSPRRFQRSLQVAGAASLSLLPGPKAAAKEWAPLDLPKLSIHGLRYTFATLSLPTGVDIKTMAANLGHANIDRRRCSCRRPTPPTAAGVPRAARRLDLASAGVVDCRRESGAAESAVNPARRLAFVGCECLIPRNRVPAGMPTRREEPG